MSNVPEDRKYTESHEWLSLDADGWLYSVSLADAGELRA
jgi:glycine cleavage system H lipoate-binding protein